MAGKMAKRKPRTLAADLGHKEKGAKIGAVDKPSFGGHPGGSAGKGPTPSFPMEKAPGGKKARTKAGGSKSKRATVAGGSPAVDRRGRKK